MKGLLLKSKWFWSGWISNRYNFVIMPVSKGVDSGKFGPRDVKDMKQFFSNGNVWVYHKVTRIDVKYQFPNIMLRREGCPVVLDARELNSFEPLNDLIDSLLKVNVSVLVFCHSGQVASLRPGTFEVVVESYGSVPELSFGKWDFWVQKKVRSLFGSGDLVVSKSTDS